MLGCSLMYLDLQGNNISGSLPETIITVQRLKSLSLGQNSITGTWVIWDGCMRECVKVY